MSFLRKRPEIDGAFFKDGFTVDNTMVLLDMLDICGLSNSKEMVIVRIVGAKHMPPGGTVSYLAEHGACGVGKNARQIVTGPGLYGMAQARYWNQWFWQRYAESYAEEEATDSE